MDFISIIPIFLKIALLIVGAILFFWLAFATLRAILRKGAHLPYAFQKVVLSVGLPKELSKEEENKQINKERIWEKIAQAEEFFASIGGMRAQYGLNTFLFGRSDHISFEIIAKDGKIFFAVTTPKYLHRYIEQQIHAQYPHAQITEIDDYNIFKPQSRVAGAYLKFARSNMFPIKTFRKMDSDPLDAITNSLSKLTQSDGAVIQIVCRSSQKYWHKMGVKVVREMQKGRKPEQAVKAAGAEGLLGKIFHSVFSGSKEMSKIAYTGKTESERRLQNEQKGAVVSHKLSQMEEEMARGLEEKTSKAGLDVNIRVVVSSVEQSQANMYLDNIVNAFSQYNIYEYGNRFSKAQPKSINRLVADFIYRNFDESKKLILNTEEISSVYHFPLSICETPNIEWLRSRKAPAPVDTPKEGLILGLNHYRGQETIARIKEGDRRRHVYIIGMTGVGKSVLMENMIKQDIQEGKGVCVIDPHGGLTEAVLEFVPKERTEDVVYFNPADIDRPIGMNMLEASTSEEMDFVCQEMIQIFYKLVTDPSMIGPMFEHNMRNAMLTLMADKEHPGTMVEIPRMFTDEEFQKYKLQFVTDPMVRAFWEKEMAKTSDFHKSEMLGYLISKVGRFVENEMIRNIIGQPKSGFDFREIMNKQKILLINLSKGQVGEVNSNLIGLIAVSKLQMAALARASIPEEERKDFYLYIDEFQNYVTDSIATILAEARKYKLNMTMAHQYIGQLVNGQDTKIRDAVFGNAGTMISFRIGVEDAEIMAKQFAPVFAEYDLINIEKYEAIVRLLIDNTASKAFTIAAYPPEKGDKELAGQIRELSRLKYGRERSIINAEIMERSKLGEAVKKADTVNSEASL
ncbi:MAG: type IV secretion system DNA-binding domain-containing protein [Candidatus Kuenenbacteria bacterium]